MQNLNGLEISTDLLGHFQTEHKVVLVLDYFPNGDLFAQSEQCNLNENSIRFYAATVLLLIEQTHLMGVVHRDIKAENILIG